MLPARQGGFTGHVPVYRTDICSGIPPPKIALVTAIYREKGNFCRMIQQWRVVRFQSRGGSASLMGLKAIVGDGHNIVLSIEFGGGLPMLYTHKCGSPIPEVNIE